MPRKHLIASGINKQQQAQAKIWNKLAKEIKAAAKVGGTNPEANPRLKAAIDKALQHNLSRDSIERNIHGANQDKDNQVEHTYEAYGPKGLAIIVQGLTDNSNRLLASLRGYLSKLKAEMATPNSVKINFQYCGEIIVRLDENVANRKDKFDEFELALVEELVNKGIDVNPKEIILNDDCIQILTEPNDFYKLRDLIKEMKKDDVLSSEIKWIPNDYVDLDQENYERLERFLNSCEDDDDIQWVVTNFGEVK